MLPVKISDYIKENIYYIIIAIPSVICTLIGYFMDIKPYIIHGQSKITWQCFSYMFFSTSPGHLLINFMATYIVFDAFKDYPVKIKPLIFIAFLVSGVICGISSVYINPDNLYTAGISGAVYFSFSFLMFEELSIGENKDQQFHKLGWILFWVFNIYANYAVMKHGFLIDITNHIAGVILGSFIGTMTIIYRIIISKH